MYWWLAAHSNKYTHVRTTSMTTNGGHDFTTKLGFCSVVTHLCLCTTVIMKESQSCCAFLSAKLLINLLYGTTFPDTGVQYSLLTMQSSPLLMATVLMGCWDWLEVQTHGRAEWRFASTMPGELFVTTALEHLKRRWSVRNWNSAELVSYVRWLSM